MVIARLKASHIGKQCIVGFLAAKPVKGAIGQNPVKQHGQLFHGFVPVVLSQFHHAFLNDVQRRFFVAHMVDRPFEGALFHAFQKFGEFVFRCQV